MNLGWNIDRSMFFDREVVKQLAGKAGKILGKFGRYVRTSARSSLKPAPKGRKPGKQRKAAPAKAGRTAAQKRAAKNWLLSKSPASSEWLAARAPKRDKRTGTSSPPGRPPRLHSKGSALKKILYAYDPAEKSVAIGPIAARTRGATSHALEYGGPTTFLAGGRRRSASILARPFMQPAFETNLPFLAVWRETL